MKHAICSIPLSTFSPISTPSSMFTPTSSLPISLLSAISSSFLPTPSVQSLSRVRPSANLTLMTLPKSPSLRPNPPLLPPMSGLLASPSSKHSRKPLRLFLSTLAPSPSSPIHSCSPSSTSRDTRFVAIPRIAGLPRKSQRASAALLNRLLLPHLRQPSPPQSDLRLPPAEAHPASPLPHRQVHLCPLLPSPFHPSAFLCRQSRQFLSPNFRLSPRPTYPS